MQLLVDKKFEKENAGWWPLRLGKGYNSAAPKGRRPAAIRAAEGRQRRPFRELRAAATNLEGCPSSNPSGSGKTQRTRKGPHKISDFVGTKGFL